jgi:hypothetical protein
MADHRGDAAGTVRCHRRRFRFIGQAPVQDACEKPATTTAGRAAAVWDGQPDGIGYIGRRSQPGRMAGRLTMGRRPPPQDWPNHWPCEHNQRPSAVEVAHPPFSAYSADPSHAYGYNELGGHPKFASIVDTRTKASLPRGTRAARQSADADSTLCVPASRLVCPPTACSSKLTIQLRQWANGITAFAGPFCRSRLLGGNDRPRRTARFTAVGRAADNGCSPGIDGETLSPAALHCMVIQLQQLADGTGNGLRISPQVLE